MVKYKKTIEVSVVKDLVNQFLLLCDDNSDQWRGMRRGQTALLEDILVKTGNYKGFRYLKQNEVPADSLPGIRENQSFENTDSTRVKYF